MNDSQITIDATDKTTLIAHFSALPGVAPRNFCRAHVLDIDWPQAKKSSVQMKSTPKKNAILLRAYAWEFHDAAPLVTLISWLGGVISAATLGDKVFGGSVVAFVIGFLPILLLLLLFWPNIERE